MQEVGRVQAAGGHRIVPVARCELRREGETRGPAGCAHWGAIDWWGEELSGCHVHMHR